MSDFINYNKRSVTLPFGCKDLAELLARKSQPGDTNRKCEKLSAVGEYISRAWESSAEGVVLCIAPGRRVDPGQDAELCFTLRRLPGTGLTANVQVRMGSENETALRLFLERHSYSQPDTSSPVHFNPNLPIEVIWNISPFPSQAKELTALATTVFRQVCRLTDDSEVTICYQEVIRWH